MPALSKAVFGFFGSRLIIMLSTIGVVLINTHYLGAEGQGTAGLINFGVLMIVALSNFIGGGALVYLIPRMSAGVTVMPSLIWASVSSVAFYIFFSLVPVLPSELVGHICTMGFIQSLFIYMAQITLAKEDARAYNISVSIQSMSMCVALFILMEFLEWHSIWALVSAMYISFFIALAMFAGYTFHHLRHVKWSTEKSTWKEMFRLGKFAQGGNVLHILNQRLNVVFLENLAVAGRAQAGIFSIALYGAEAIWTVAKSLSVEQYSRISNSQNPIEHHSITGKYLKISMLVAATAAGVILLLPQSFYTIIFQKEIDGLKNVLVALIPGIMANSASIIFAHYFSGTGLHKHNFIASALGLALGVITAFLFIPTYGSTAAAASASVAFGIQAVYFALVYIRTKRATLTTISVQD